MVGRGLLVLVLFRRTTHDRRGCRKRPRRQGRHDQSGRASPLTVEVIDRNGERMTDVVASNADLTASDRARVHAARPEWLPRSYRRLQVAAGVLIGGLAFLVRLAALLRGGGLFGYGNYDDGVYFASSLALVHGQLPYRDFLVLHPPGVMLALSPFAFISQWIGEPDSLAAARIFWILLGSVSAVIVLRILWPYTRLGAVLGGLFYALYYPAVFAEHLTLLEVPQSLVLLLAVLILTRTFARPAVSGWSHPWLWLLAGALVGLSPTLKIWGVISVLAVAVCVLAVRGWRRMLLVLLGAATACTIVCLPVFVGSPGRMWRFVVLDQLGRAQSSSHMATRVASIAGLRLYGVKHPSPILLGVAIMIALLVLGLALTVRWARFFVVLLVLTVAVLLAAPTWYQHYPAFAAGPAALVVGSATGALSQRLPRRAMAQPLLAVVLIVGLMAYAAPLITLKLGHRFPLQRLAVAAQTSRCVTTDDPMNLIELNLVGRNISRNCPVMVDLGGYVFDLPVHGQRVSRRADPAWQSLALRYLGSGSRTVMSRLNTSYYRSFTPASRRRINSWWIIVSVGQTRVRAPIDPPVG